MKDIKYRAFFSGHMWTVQTIQFFNSGIGLKLLRSDEKAKIYEAITNPGSNVQIIQFIGIKDENGKDIYEGDKFIDEDLDQGEYYLVVYNNSEARFQINLYGYGVSIGEGSQEVYSNEISLIDENIFDMSCLTEMEIIGNIFQTTNP